MTDFQRVLNFLEAEGIYYKKDFLYDSDKEEITDYFIIIDDALHFNKNEEYDV